MYHLPHLEELDYSYIHLDIHTRPNFLQPSSRIALVYQSFCS